MEPEVEKALLSWDVGTRVALTLKTSKVRWFTTRCAWCVRDPRHPLQRNAHEALPGPAMQAWPISTLPRTGTKAQHRGAALMGPRMPPWSPQCRSLSAEQAIARP